MLVSTYVSTKLKQLNAESLSDRLYGNLAIASIHRNSEVTANGKKAIDTLLERLAKRIGTTAAPSPKSAPKSVPVVSATNTQALLEGIDPATGDRLHRVKLLDGSIALHNPSTRVVHPVPGSNNLQAYI
jgi:hypothetical protein